MRKAIETLKNIWKIEDLRQRILITILFVAIYRFGSYVVLPGINPSMLTQLHQQTSEGLLALLNMFSGGAFSNASIFALGIMPYISASIVIQLLGIAVPYFQKLQREGESGRRKMNQYTRYLTILILLVQAPSYLLNLKMQAGPSLNASLDWTLFMFTSTIILAAGSMFILWLGERITDKGIGNGISLIIMIGIIARLPQSLFQELISRMTDKTGGLVMFLIELVVLEIPEHPFGQTGHRGTDGTAQLHGDIVAWQHYLMNLFVNGRLILLNPSQFGGREVARRIQQM